jgi:hypothetical protein
VFVEPEPTPAEVPAVDEAVKESVNCEERWGCWDLLHTMPGTVLGVRATLGYVWNQRKDQLGAGFTAVYLTEHYATHDAMTVHFAGMAALGRGTQGTEGGLRVALDFGFRAKVSDVSGPFVRVGAEGLLFGHNALFVGMLEPLKGRVGYQYLRGDMLVEVAVTQGYVPLARYEAVGGRLDLSRSIELGGYVAVNVAPLRGTLSFAQLMSPEGDKHDLQIGHFALCSDELEITLCADLWVTSGRVDMGARGRLLTQALYGGIIIGLSP